MSGIDNALSGALIGVAADLQLDLLEAEHLAKVYEADMRRAVRRHLTGRLHGERNVQVEASLGKDVVSGAGTTDVG